jgi:hypothetical protein
MSKPVSLILAAIQIILVSFGAGAGSFNAQGQFIGTVSTRVTFLLAQFPDGGPGLRAAVAVLLEGDPTLADDVVFAARTATPGQKQAIGMGIADAARYFAVCAGAGTEACRAAEATLRLALLYADPDVRIAFLEIAGSEVAADIPPIFIPGVGTTNCISPASPSGC